MIEKAGPVSRESVLKGTGRDWDQWLATLDKAGARAWTHQEIVAHLRKKHRLTPWWQQGVTTGYEIVIGRRVAGRDLKGRFSVTVTKTYPIGDKKLWKLLASPEGLAAWLKPLGPFKLRVKSPFETEDGAFGEVRTMLAGRRARLSWHLSDGGKPSVIQLYVLARPGSKSMIAFMHEGLVDGRLREPLRARWREAAENLLGLIRASD